MSLRPTDVTRHFVASHYSPSDVAAAIGMLRENLGQLGVKVRSFPKREASTTSNEGALTASLKRADESELEPRITHDVDCVAAILVLRRGERSFSLDTERAVFATTSASVVRTVRDWYRRTGEAGVPPVIHAWALSNAAWLKKPTAATNKKLHELVALCSAALRPSPKAWKAFLKELARLHSEGKISSVEQVSLVARELVTCRLADVDGDGEVDANTIGEVIEQARAEEDERTQRAVAEVQSDADRKLAAAEAALSNAQVAHRTLAEERRQLELRIRGRARRLARAVSTLFFGLSVVVVTAGVALSLPGVFPEVPGAVRVVCWALALPVALLGVMNLLVGTYIQGLRLKLEGWIERGAVQWLTGRQGTEP